MALQPDGRALVVGGGVGYPVPLPYGFIAARYLTMPVPKGAALDAGTGIVSVRGDDAANSINVSFDAAAGEVVVSVDGVVSRFPAAAASRVDVRGFGGNDTVTFAGGAPHGMIDAGAGDDHITFDGVGGASLRKIFGGAGNDKLTLTDGDGATISFDGGDGAADEVVLLGSAGDDQLTLNSNTIDAVGYAATYTTPATELLTVNTLGGADTISLGSTLRAKATVDAGSGDDTFDLLPPERDFYGNRVGQIVSLAGGDGADGLSYTGSTLNDSLTLAPTVLTHGIYTAAFINGIERADLFGGEGNDAFYLDPAATAALHADGGAGTDTVTFFGRSGGVDDVILLTPSSVTSDGRTLAMSAGIEAVSVQAGSGNDAVTMEGSAPTVNVTVNGEAGDDVLNVNGAPWASVVFFGGTSGGWSDTLNVSAGTFTFASDARFSTQNLTINIADGAAVVFNATQRLAALNLNGGTATLSAAGNRILVTRALSITGGGR